MLEEPRLDGVQVLVVEDDRDSREMLADLLRLLGATVREADGGTRAYDLFVEERPDIVLSDLQMPNGDGYELVRRIRALDPDSTSLTPALALSSSESMHEAILAGFHAFAAKPVELEQLVQVIGDFVRPDPTPQAVAPWTLSERDAGTVVITLDGQVRSADTRRLTEALAVHLERAPCAIVADVRRVTSFTPSCASAAEHGIWHLRRRIRRVRVVGGSLFSRIVSAGACAVLRVPSTFSSTFEDAERPEPW